MTGSQAPIERVATAVAGLAVAEADAGATSQSLIRRIWPFLERHGLDDSTGLRIVAAAVQESQLDVGDEPWSARHRAMVILEDAARRMDAVDTQAGSPIE